LAGGAEILFTGYAEDPLDGLHSPKQRQAGQNPFMRRPGTPPSYSWISTEDVRRRWRSALNDV
jgi:hypothetical protein